MRIAEGEIIDEFRKPASEVGRSAQAGDPETISIGSGKTGWSVINEQGMARVPELKAIPQFSLEEELKSAASFILEPVVPAGQKNPPKPRPMDREELAALATASPSAAAAHAEHDDD